MNSIPPIPPIAPDITFEDAIAASRIFLDRLAAGLLSDADITATVTALVQTTQGARGFFVVYLTDERSLADQPQPALYKGLYGEPQGVGDLLVKNLAMSTAMALYHERNQDFVIAQKSQRVSRRSATLIQTLKLDNTQPKLAQLQATLAQGDGEYREFLERWGYDAEQKAAIAAAVEPLLVSSH